MPKNDTKTIDRPSPIRRPEPIPGLPGIYHSPPDSWPGLSRRTYVGRR